MKNGFSLIEVLVAISILTLGVIGTAGLQLAALRTARQSAFHAFALQLATEMADTMRADHGRARQTGGVTGGVDPYVGMDYRSAEGEPARPAKLCYASACDAQELAAFEIYEWKKRIRAALPGGRVKVCRDASPWDASKKTLSWNCEGAMDDSAPVVVKFGWQSKNPDGSLIRDANGSFPPAVALAVAL